LEHGGRIANTAGDSVLAEFASVVDAVECAIAVQEQLAAANAARPEAQQLQFRIGIHLGDVIPTGGDLLGDGVNIAARLEQATEPGTVAISRPVRDQIRDRGTFLITDLGELHAKNIARPLRGFRVSRRSAQPTARPIQRVRQTRIAIVVSVTAAVAVSAGLLLRGPKQHVAGQKVAVESPAAFPLPDKPSVAVLPFKNMSDDRSQDYLGDALAENLISALSNVSGLFVISRGSSFAAQSGSATPRNISDQLGVRYLLDGSVQRSGDRVRVTAHLTDAISGQTVWTDRYDPGAADFFRLQDEIAIRVVTELRVRLTEGEQARISSSRSRNLEVVELSHRAQAHFRRFTRPDNEKVKELAQAALAIDPADDFSYLMLAWAHYMDVLRQWSSDPAASLHKVQETLGRAEELRGNDDVQILYLRGGIALAQRQYDEAIALARRVVQLSPSFAEGRASLGLALLTAGKYEDAIGEFQQAMRLSPVYPGWYLYNYGAAQRLSGRLAEAKAAFEQVLQRNPDDGRARLDLALVQSKLGDEGAARQGIIEYLRRDPGNSLRRWLETRYRDGAVMQQDVELLTRLGLPKV
jgi:adenylate cyclase